MNYVHKVWFLNGSPDIEENTLKSQEVGGTLIGENELVVMTGAESVEWFQIHQTNGFQVFDEIPFAPFRPL